MSLTLRPVVDAEEVLDLARVMEQAFNDKPWSPKEPNDWMLAALDRVVAVFDGDDIVSGGRCYPLELTVPGGRSLPMAGVSWIGTVPTHRRRGAQRAVMRWLVDDAVERGEPIAGLLASESLLYGRYGFGIATQMCAMELGRNEVHLLDRHDHGGRLRLHEADRAAELLPGAYRSIMALRPGSVSRPEAWWSPEYFDTPNDDRHFRFVTHHDADDVIDGFLAYTVDTKWAAGIATGTAQVEDMEAAGPQARLALWQYLLDLDLVASVTVLAAPLDDPIRLAVDDPRRIRITEQRDMLWLRPLDVVAMLERREYSADGRLVVEVRDPDGPAAGTYVLEVDEGRGACRRTDADPDCALDARDLGSVYLGGLRWSTLADAGRVHAPQRSTLRFADACFASDPLPATTTWF